jgi:hypothetical protein
LVLTYVNPDKEEQLFCPNPEILWEEAVEACLPRFVSAEALLAHLGHREKPNVKRCSQELLRHWAEEARRDFERRHLGFR